MRVGLWDEQKLFTVEHPKYHRRCPEFYNGWWCERGWQKATKLVQILSLL